MRHPAVPCALVGETDPQRRDRSALERGHGVQRVAAPERADPPRRVGAEVPRAVGHHDHVCREHLLGREHARPHRDGFELAAERLPAGDPPVEQPGIAEVEHQAGERAGQRGAIGHDVHDACIARPLGARGDRSEHRVQRGADDRRLLEAGRRFQRFAMGLLDARDGGLQRRIARLHGPSGGRRRPCRSRPRPRRRSARLRCPIRAPPRSC